MLQSNQLIGFGAASGASVAPTAWTFTATSTDAAFTDPPTQAGMSDGTTTGGTSVWGSASGTGTQTLTADFGSNKIVSNVYVRANTTVGWGVTYTNNATIEHSLDDSSYTTITTVSGLVGGALGTFAAGGVTARYVRIRNTSTASGFLGAGDFHFD